MNVIVGDNTGLLKQVSLRTNGSIKKMGSQESARGGINALCWAGLHNREAEVAIALGGGNIEVWNPATETRVALLPGTLNATEGTKYVGLHVLRDLTSAKIKRRIVNVMSNGCARVIPWLEHQIGELELEDDDEQFDGLTESQKNALRRKLATEHALKLREQQEQIESETVEWNLGRNVERSRLAPNNEILASGGKNNKVALYDIETQTQVFQAKNLANDWLNMQVPNWDMDFAFLTGGCAEPWTNSGLVDFKIATSTGYHNVRIYDVKASRRPVVDVNIGQHPARAIANTNCGNYLIVGDAAGRIQKLDIRANLRQVGVFKGNCGSVREVQVHPTLPMVASVGLDRHLRIHDIDTRKLLKEVYLTQKLTGCLFSALEPSKKLGRSSVSDNINSKEAEDAWEELEKLSKQNSRSVVNSRSNKEADDEDEDEDEDEDIEVEEEIEVVKGSKKIEKVVPSKKNSAIVHEDMVHDDDDDEDDEDEDDEDMDEDMIDMDEDMFDMEEDEDDFYGDEDEDEEFEPFTVSFKLLGDDKVVSSAGANTAQVAAPVVVKAPVTAKQPPTKQVSSAKLQPAPTNNNKTKPTTNTSAPSKKQRK